MASAGCQNAFLDRPVPDTKTDHGNWNGTYPPAFYLLMGSVVTEEVDRSVLLVRLVNAVLTVALVGLVAGAVPRRLRPLAVVPLFVTSVPLGLSLFSSTNPSSWAVISAATLWLTLYASFETRGRRRSLLLGTSLLMMLVGSGSRGDACLFSVFAVLLVFLLRHRELRGNRLPVATGLLCAAVSIWIFLGTQQSAAVAIGIDGSESLGLPWLDVAVKNLTELPIILLGGFGYEFMGATGWFDTRFPALVGVLSTAAWLSVLMRSTRPLSRAHVVAMSTCGLALVVYPLVMLGRTGVFVGTAFQPRYALPLVVIFTGVALLGGVEGRSGLRNGQRAFVIGALSIAHCCALFTQIRRYVTGLDVYGLNLDADREWWWNLPVSATVVWLVGSAAFLIACSLALGPWWGPEPRRSSERSSPVLDEVAPDQPGQATSSGPAGPP